MSEYEVELSGNAQDSIERIHRYIRDELCNPSAAKRFLIDTDDAISSLRCFPYAHMVRPGSKIVGTIEKRQFFYRKNHCLFCIVKEESKIIRILEVTYSYRNLDFIEEL